MNWIKRLIQGALSYFYEEHYSILRLNAILAQQASNLLALREMSKAEITFGVVKTFAMAQALKDKLVIQGCDLEEVVVVTAKEWQYAQHLKQAQGKILLIVYSLFALGWRERKRRVAVVLYNSPTRDYRIQSEGRIDWANTKSALLIGDKLRYFEGIEVNRSFSKVLEDFRVI